MMNVFSVGDLVIVRGFDTGISTGEVSFPVRDAVTRKLLFIGRDNGGIGIIVRRLDEYDYYHVIFRSQILEIINSFIGPIG